MFKQADRFSIAESAEECIELFTRKLSGNFFMKNRFENTNEVKRKVTMRSIIDNKRLKWYIRN